MTTTKFELAVEGRMQHATRIDRRIAMEAGFLSNFVTTVREAIPSMMASISDALASLKFASDERTPLQSYTLFLNLLGKSNFVEIGDTRISVPEGFEGHLPSYVEHLKKCAEFDRGIIADVLIPYNTFLSQLLSSDSARKSSIGQLGNFLKINEERKRLNDIGASFFIKGSTQVKQPMGKVLNRNSEWRDLLTDQNAAIQAINEVDRKSVQKMVDQCVELIDTIKTASSSGEFDSLSGPMVKQLSEATLAVANQVTFYSITLYRVSGMDKVISESVDILTKELKK
jgi:hypothetical protein